MHSQKRRSTHPPIYKAYSNERDKALTPLNSRNLDPTGLHWQHREQVIHGRRSLMNMPTGTLRNWAKELSVNCCMPMLRLLQINRSRRLKTFLHKNLMHWFWFQWEQQLWQPQLKEPWPREFQLYCVQVQWKPIISSLRLVQTFMPAGPVWLNILEKNSMVKAESWWWQGFLE